MEGAQPYISQRGDDGPCVCMLGHFSRVSLCNSVACSPPGSSVHGILQARTLEWEKGMATHSSILAWEIPWTEEPGGMWSYTLSVSIFIVWTCSFFFDQSFARVSMIMESKDKLETND